MRCVEAGVEAVQVRVRFGKCGRDQWTRVCEGRRGWREAKVAVWLLRRGCESRCAREGAEEILHVKNGSWNWRWYGPRRKQGLQRTKEKERLTLG